MEKRKINEAYPSSDTRASLAAVNGIIAFNIVYPFIIVLLMQVIMRDAYPTFVNENYNLANLIVNLVSTIISIVVSLLILQPKTLIKAFKKFDTKGVKTIFLTLGSIVAFTMIYNSIVLIANPNIGSGNENQQLVGSIVKDVPILAFLLFCVVGPVLEELSYRYCIFGSIIKYNRITAYLISSLFFMVAHGIAGFVSPDANILNEFLLLPPYLFAGLALAYAYDKTDNLLVPMSVHILNNVLSFALMFI